METCEQQTLPTFEDMSPFCLLAYPASRLPAPESAEVRAMTAGSGRQCSMLLEQSSPLGAFSKILLESSAWTSSEEYCYVWTRLDTKFECSAFQLTPLGQNTKETGYSLWPTPRAEFDSGKHNGKPDTLHSAAKLWPTPCAREDCRSPEAHMAMKARMKGGTRKTITSLSVMAKLWPTPLYSESHCTGKPDSLRVAANLTGSQGSLNPRFVENLMGYPIDHTALKR